MPRVVVGLVVLVWASTVLAAPVMCQKRNGVVIVRQDACRKKETALVLADFGAVGPQGPAGPAGTTGPSNGYATGFTSSVALPEDGTPVTLMTLDVPEGSFVVHARLSGATVVDPDGPPGNNYRYDCTLRTAETFIDDWTARVGDQPGVESYLTFQGGFSGPGPITLTCAAGNHHPLLAENGAMTAIRVDTLN